MNRSEQQLPHEVTTITSTRHPVREPIDAERPQGVADDCQDEVSINTASALLSPQDFYQRVIDRTDLRELLARLAKR